MSWILVDWKAVLACRASEEFDLKTFFGFSALNCWVNFVPSCCGTKSSFFDIFMTTGLMALLYLDGATLNLWLCFKLAVGFTLAIGVARVKREVWICSDYIFKVRVENFVNIKL